MLLLTSRWVRAALWCMLGAQLGLDVTMGLFCHNQCITSGRNQGEQKSFCQTWTCKQMPCYVGTSDEKETDHESSGSSGSYESFGSKGLKPTPKKYILLNFLFSNMRC